MENQDSSPSGLINWKTLFTGVTQAAIIGTFVMVFSMYVNQSVQAEKIKAQEEKNKEQDVQLVQIWAILNKDEGVKSVEQEPRKRD